LVWCPRYGLVERFQRASKLLHGTHGVLLSPLCLAVCPSAACLPISGAQVPHAIGLVGCLSCGSQRNIQERQSAIRHRQFGPTTSALFHQAEASGTLIANIKGSVCAASLFIEPRPVCRVLNALYSAPQPNCQVNADATKGHAFGIFMTLACALRPGGLRRRLPW
jgi:hypothetical protein